MKKFILIAIALLVGLSATAQEQDSIKIKATEELPQPTAKSEYKIFGNGAGVGYEKIFENTGLSMQQAHDAIVSYFAKSYGDSNATNRIDQNNHILYKSTFYRVATPGFGVWWMDSDYIIDIAIRDNRIRVQAYGTIGATVDKYGARACSYYMGQTYPVTTTMTRCYKGMLQKTFDNTMANLWDILCGIADAIKNPSAVGDDW